MSNASTRVRRLGWPRRRRGKRQDWPAVAVRSAARERIVARTPRALIALGLVVLSALGLRALVASPSQAPLSGAGPASADLEATGLAEAFARAYLSWDAERPQDRERALERLGTSALDAGIEPPSEGHQRVLWTAPVAERAAPGGGRMITIAVALEGGPVLHLAVPIGRAPGDRPYVAERPALVGPPPLGDAPARATPPPVEDPALVEVARRALANYVAGDGANLAADLAPEASVAPLARPIAATVGEPAWIDRASGWLAVPVDAELPGGARADLRYELRAVWRERWLVAALEPHTA